MKVTLEKLFNSEKALAELLKSKLKAKTSWNVNKLIKVYVDEVKSFDEIKNKKIEELGEKDKDGKFKLKKENEEKHLSEIKEVLNSEVEVNIPKFKFDDLDGFETTPMNISSLDWIIEEENV